MDMIRARELVPAESGPAHIPPFLFQTQSPVAAKRAFGVLVVLPRPGWSREVVRLSGLVSS
jgi:hypothetical protein